MEIQMPDFDIQAMVENTRAKPVWVHFGAGNIFRGFIALLQQTLLEQNLANTGIVAAETFDFEIIDRVYRPYDNMSLLVTMCSDGSLTKRVVASIAESLVGDPARADDWERLTAIFREPALQLASFTVTEKGYAVTGLSNGLLQIVQRDIEKGPAQPVHLISKIVALLLERWKHGAAPLALVSMDNCAHNGEVLRSAVMTIAQEWLHRGHVEDGFLKWLENPSMVSFPWTMIDKITPQASEKVKAELEAIGYESTELILTAKGSLSAPFVNAEEAQYLVIEDCFPNGRPVLEKAGVMLVDRATVNRVEKMKVGTCLNPLHTALAVFGCLLGYELIAEEMKDPALRKLVENIGYTEGLPVVANPGIIDPMSFLGEVIKKRLPNPFIPDTPQRIATDTSHKIPVRFGETIKTYCERPDLDVRNLIFIPLVIAAWCRYLMGVDDADNAMTPSPDPRLPELLEYIRPIHLGDPASLGEHLRPILSDETLFGKDLYQIGLGSKVEDFFREMIAGLGAVRQVLEHYTLERENATCK
jgi:fructuronate reductase